MLTVALRSLKIRPSTPSYDHCAVSAVRAALSSHEPNGVMSRSRIDALVESWLVFLVSDRRIERAGNGDGAALNGAGDGKAKRQSSECRARSIAAH